MPTIVRERKMNNALKGALLSGLVFPGLGQIILKQYKRGAALMITAFASMIVFVVNATQQAFKILENVDLESGAIDFDTISKAEIGRASCRERV